MGKITDRHGRRRQSDVAPPHELLGHTGLASLNALDRHCHLAQDRIGPEQWHVDRALAIGGEDATFAWKYRRRYLNKAERLTVQAIRTTIKDGRHPTPAEQQQLARIVVRVRTAELARWRAA